MSASPAVAPELKYADLYQRVSNVIPEWEWQKFLPDIDAINRLKAERNAVILGHNYQTPEIFHGVADLTGDSLALARMAAESDADVIVLCGVHFMAETAKIVNPEKTVLIPDLGAGCSLAASISGQDVRNLKVQHPGVPVVSYVNTTADVKAETDMCCTSANAVEVVEAICADWGVDRVIFLPDQYLGHYVAGQTDIELILWDGACEVHEKFTAQEIRSFRDQHNGELHVIAHPECPQDVLKEADYVGSTSGMIKHLDSGLYPKVAMITECSMSDNVAVEHPEIEFIRPCNLCPHMKQITLPKIRAALEQLQYEIIIDAETCARARGSVERMIALGR